MMPWAEKRKLRRQQVREKRVRTTASTRARLRSRLASLSALICLCFLAGSAGIALWGEATLGYSLGERIRQPIYARVSFKVPDAQRTAADKEAARAATPSYYGWNAGALTFDKIRADLMRLYEIAANAGTFEEYAQANQEQLWPAEPAAYRRLRELVELPEERGRAQFDAWVKALPLESEHVARGLAREPRTPKGTADFIVVERLADDGGRESTKVPHSRVVVQGNEKAVRGSASDVARSCPAWELRSTIEEIVVQTFREQPTIIFQQERTLQAMRDAEEAVPEAMTPYEEGKPFVTPGVLRQRDYELLKAERAAYQEFLRQDDPKARALRQARLLERAGLSTLVVLLSVGLLVYLGMNQPRLLDSPARTAAVIGLVLAALVAGRVLDLQWGHRPELLLIPCLTGACVLAIVYPRRFALGAACILAVLVCITVREDLVTLMTLFTGVAVMAFQLHEIRTRTKLIGAGMVTACAVFLASTAGGLAHVHSLEFILEHALWAAGCALLSAFLVSGLLPFIERLFRVATSLTLLEWRDPTRPLLQLLAREAPGTYNHSLVLGTLAEAACENIGANALLAQVGALYHDVGKIPKAEYFAENQEGRISRHDRLAPTMSLLIILGHVKDGIEMAKEYRLPRVLHQFIEEHHGTTVVRYFHHMASEKQPQIASGRHDREVPEAEFRYAGPKPRTPESAVLMLCDGVEGAVRALSEPTVGRIEHVVHQIVMDRLQDGQFDDCDITLREIRQVEDSLVKSLCSIYHGRVAYPKARKPAEETVVQTGVGSSSAAG